MPRSRRAKSQSISSNPSEVALVNGSMAPPSPPSVAKATPTRTRKHVPSTTSPTGGVAVVTAPKTGTPSIPPRETPGVGQFILVAGLSSLIEAILQSVLSQFGTGELAAISKHSESWAEVGGLLAWKFFTLGVYWFGNFDAYDVASLTLLLHTPTTVLIYFFYLIHPTTILLTTISTLTSTTVPFLIFRPLLPQHDPKSHPHAPKTLLRNRSIITDPNISLSTSVLATAIFAVLLELSFQTFLPVWLVTHFSHLRSLEFSHSGPAALPILLIALAPAGFACLQFLFTPSTGTTEFTLSPYSFDPSTSGFVAHIYHNVWGWYSARQKELISRTTVLATLVLAETVVQTWGAMKDVELIGAVGYAGVWATAIGVVGAVLEWVGGPSD